MRTSLLAPKSVAVLLAAGALAACGTTVPAAQRAGVGADTGLAAAQGGTGLGDSGGPAGGAAADDAAVGGAAGLPRGQAGQDAVQPGTPAGQDTEGASTTSGPGAVGKPVKAGAAGSPVELGFIYTETGGVFLAAMGLKGSIADGRIYADALLKYINARGGLAGHPVKPVYYNMDLTRQDPYSVWMQEICSLWTEDHSVLAGQVGANSNFSPVAECLGKKGALFDNPSAWVRTKADHRKYPRWVEPLGFTAERLAREYVEVPKQLGYFGAKPKIGVLVYDYPQSGEMAGLLSEALRREGFEKPTTVTIHMGESTSDLSNTITQAQAAALKFRAEGVDHVMSVAYPGALPFFMQYAQSQDYFPRYALTSLEGLMAVAANVPAQQLKDAVAVGWMPDADVGAPDRPPFNDTAALCKKIFTDAGIAESSHAGGFTYCQWVLLLHKAAGQLDGRALDGNALLDAVNRTGAGFTTPGTFASSLSAAKHDGVSAVRPVRFDSACTCWKYAGPVRSVP